MASGKELKELASESNAPSTGFLPDALSTISRGVSNMVSGDVEIRRQMQLDQLSPGERLKYIASTAEISAETPIETTGTAFGTGFVNTIPFAVGIGVLSQAVPQARAASGAGRIVTGLQNAISNYGRAFRSSPGTTIAGESFTGGVAGASGFTLERAFPDLPGARLIGELGGGLSAGYVPQALKLAPSLKIFSSLKQRMAPSAARQRASDILAAGDRQGALRALREAEELSPGAAISTFTRTESPVYSAFEKAIIKGAEDGNLSERIATSIEQTNSAIRNDLTFGGASEQDISNLFENQVQLFGNLLDARMQIATSRANTAISKVQPQDVKEAIEPVVRDELSVALREAREFEDELYKAIDQEDIVNVNISKIARNQADATLATAQKGNMPNAARFLDPENTAFIGDQTSIFQIRGIQSELRAEARAARAGDNPNFQRARLAEDIADSITEDIANIYVNSADENTVATAVAFSRELNQRFNQGDVARILRRDRTGAESIDPSKTLTATLGAGKQKNTVAYDRILQAVSGKPEVQQAMEEFLRFNFFRGQEFNARDAQNFLISNQDLMNRMPAFRSEIQNAIRTNNTESLLRSRREGRPFLSPKQNKAIIYIEQGAEDAFNKVLSSRTTARDMRSLMIMAGRDTTGEATAGLKTSFADFLLNKSTSNISLPNGTTRQIVDGAKFRALVDDKRTKQAIITLFSKEERARLERASRTVNALSRQLASRTPVELFAEQDMNLLQRAALRISGASVGRGLGTGTLQAPQLVADIFENMARGGIIGAERRLLEDAIFDEDLFKALLENPSDGPISIKSQRALRAWAAQTLATYGNEQQGDTEANIQ